MRIDKKETMVYPFNELTDEAKEKAIELLAGINVNYEWWNFTYENAAQAGIKITSFDLVRGNTTCEGKLIDDAENVAKKIIDQHGACCATHKTATEFIEARNELVSKCLNGMNFNKVDELEDEFKQSILEDYRIMLQKEYEYLTSEEAIVETVEANEYEFTEDGKLYH